MDDSDRGSASTPFAVLIIGAGFGGLGMAIELGRAGEHDVLLLEKGRDVGGVWRENTYPGAACDIPSHLYSFSFEPNPHWSRTYSPQSEILHYLRHCADKYAVRDKIRFGCEVMSAAFDEQASLWRVEWIDPPGQAHTSHARVVVSAVGLLSRPLVPTLLGLATFAGPVFHSAQWDHDVVAEGQARRGHRHRRVGDPVRARDRARRRAPDRVPAHAVVHPAAPRPRVLGARTAPLRALAVADGGAPRADLRGARRPRQSASRGCAG